MVLRGYIYKVVLYDISISVCLTNSIIETVSPFLTDSRKALTTHCNSGTTRPYHGRNTLRTVSQAHPTLSRAKCTPTSGISTSWPNFKFDTRYHATRHGRSLGGRSHCKIHPQPDYWHWGFVSLVAYPSQSRFSMDAKASSAWVPCLGFCVPFAWVPFDPWRRSRDTPRNRVLGIETPPTIPCLCQETDDNVYPVTIVEPLFRSSSGALTNVAIDPGRFCKLKSLDLYLALIDQSWVRLRSRADSGVISCDTTRMWHVTIRFLVLVFRLRYPVSPR